MYPPGDNRPLAAEVGDKIEHKLVPGFVMTVLGIGLCQADAARPEEHRSYSIIDPEDMPDWVCAYDVRAAVSDDG